jgi:hypothetical protein
VSDGGGNCLAPALAFTGQTSTKTFRSMGCCKACLPAKVLRHLTDGGLLARDRLTRHRSRRAAHETLGQNRKSDRARLAAECRHRISIALLWVVEAAQQVLEARLGTQRVEPWIGAEFFREAIMRDVLPDHDSETRSVSEKCEHAPSS